MGLWVSCSQCAGTGFGACTCGGHGEACLLCSSTGKIVCSKCQGRGNIYLLNNDHDEDEFAFDEY